MDDEILSYTVVAKFTTYVDGKLREFDRGEIIPVSVAATFGNLASLTWAYLTPNTFPAPARR